MEMPDEIAFGGLSSSCVTSVSSVHRNRLHIESSVSDVDFEWFWSLYILLLLQCRQDHLIRTISYTPFVQHIQSLQSAKDEPGVANVPKPRQDRATDSHDHVLIDQTTKGLNMSQPNGRSRCSTRGTRAFDALLLNATQILAISCDCIPNLLTLRRLSV